MTPKEIRDKRYVINKTCEAVKLEAAGKYLSTVCNTVPVKLESEWFLASKNITPIGSCPNYQNGLCDTCPYLVNYTLDYKECKGTAWCLKNDMAIRDEEAAKETKKKRGRPKKRIEKGE